MGELMDKEERAWDAAAWTEWLATGAVQAGDDEQAVSFWCWIVTRDL